MKVAAIYDIHGNEPALEAVLSEIQEEQPDLILVGGDIISGPLPRGTLERLWQLGERVRMIRGNADREVVAAFDDLPFAKDLPPEVRATTQWAADQLERAHRDFLANLPQQLTMQIDGLGDVLFCHATPRNDEDIFTVASPEERWQLFFAGVRQQMVVCGHTHMQFERHREGLRIVNAGSVGMPYADQPGAYWAMLGPDVTFRRTSYDLPGAAERMRASGYPDVEKFIEENVLNVPTADEATAFFERLIAKQALE